MGQIVQEYFLWFFGATIVAGWALGIATYYWRRNKCPHNMNCPLVETCVR